MEANGSQWKPMEANGSQWKPMEANGSQWKPMEANGRDVDRDYVLSKLITMAL